MAKPNPFSARTCRSLSKVPSPGLQRQLRLQQVERKQLRQETRNDAYFVPQEVEEEKPIGIPKPRVYTPGRVGNTFARKERRLVWLEAGKAPFERMACNWKARKSCEAFGRVPEKPGGGRILCLEGRLGLGRKPGGSATRQIGKDRPSNRARRRGASGVGTGCLPGPARPSGSSPDRATGRRAGEQEFSLGSSIEGEWGDTLFSVRSLL